MTDAAKLAAAGPGPSGATTDAPDAWEEIEISFPSLAARTQTSPLPVPMQNPVLLPLPELDPEVLERLVAEIVHRQDNHGAQFYGRRGQKQYGLDIVERENQGARSLYQVKRFQQLHPSAIDDAVEEYAGPPRGVDYGGEPRRFNPRRFVVVTSATLEADTHNIDEVARLQEAYGRDLEIEVWGAETLSRKLRDAPNLVYAVFGSDWARAFCGFEPTPVAPASPRSLALVEEPTEVLGLAPMVADAQQLESRDPATAAKLFATIASQLDSHNFPGHAALMRRRQATAAAASDDTHQAFEARWRLALDGVLRGDHLVAIAHGGIDELTSRLSAVQVAKWMTLKSLTDWYEQGSQLSTVVPELTIAVSAGDSDAAVLCCLALEQAIVDNIHEHDPPYALVGNVQENTPQLLAELRALAARCTSPDPLLRARLRCAVADASLPMTASLAEVDITFGQLVTDALAGRYLTAGPLVTSRAAYQFAVHGDVERAESLWRQSVLGSSEAGHYGDVRNALRASHMVRADSGILPLIGLDVVVAALPDRRQLLGGATDTTLLALEAAQRGELVNGFGRARRDLWAARTAGHLVEELIALRLFADVLLAGGHPGGAVQPYVLAGEAEKATSIAKTLTVPADITRWLESPLRRRRAAAIQALAAQARLVADADVPGIVQRLLAESAAAWSMPWIGSSPERDAIRAIAAFGDRIPIEAVDPLLNLARPAQTASTGLSDLLAEVLIQAYWAVPSRRDGVAIALADMMRLPQPPHNLWGYIRSLPESARQPLLPSVRGLAAAGHRGAIETLAGWGDASEVVQLAARQACAVLLRKPLGVERTHHAIGTQEAVTVQLLECLLLAEQETSFPASALLPSRSQPAGGVLFYTGVVTCDAQGADEPTTPPAPAPYQEEEAVDDAAVIAAGQRDALAIAVARQLIALATDTTATAAERFQALVALHPLLRHLPRTVNSEFAPRLLQLHESPSLSAIDEWEIASNVPLSRSRIDTGAGSLAPVALVAAAEAFAHGRDSAALPSELEILIGRQLVAAAMPLHMNDHARFGAIAIVAVASAAPTFGHHATALLLHPNENVRALGVEQAPFDDILFAQLVNDHSALVRRQVAARASELQSSSRELLAGDQDVLVRRVLEDACASPADPPGRSTEGLQAL